MHTPAQIITQFTTSISQQGLPTGQQEYYLKWVRFYCDFYHTYNDKQGTETCLSAFAKKLVQKKQPIHLQKQAEQAARSYFAVTVFSWEKTENPQFRGNIPNRNTIVPTRDNNFRQEYNKLEPSSTQVNQTITIVENPLETKWR